MKKILLSILLLFPVLCAQTVSATETEATTMVQPKVKAKQIVGKWVANFKELLPEGSSADEFLQSMDKTELQIIFMKDMTAKMGFIFEGKIKQDDQDFSLALGFSANLGCNYFISNDDKLTVKINEQKPEIDIYKLKLEVSDEARSLMESLGFTENTLKKMMLEQIEKGGPFEPMAENLGVLNIIKLTPTELILSDENGKQLNFKKAN